RLLDQPFRQLVRTGEIDVPAVRGLGGSLLYFVDDGSDLSRHWDIDFDPQPVAANADAGLTAIDHIAQSMQHEEMLTWLLFYASRTGGRKTAVQDGFDPGGMVQSQVVESLDGVFRLVLNASQSRHTQSSQFLDHLLGSGVQHIALATNDIFATVD